MNEAAFLTELKVLDVSEGYETDTLELEADFRVYSGVLDAIVNVPAGFRCDGESVPVAIRFLVPKFGQSKRAAIVHDYLYRTGGYNTVDGCFKPVCRSMADKVYKELALLKGTPAWRAWLRYSVLRLVGWKAWNEGKAMREKVI